LRKAIAEAQSATRKKIATFTLTNHKLTITKTFAIEFSAIGGGGCCWCC